MKRLDRRLRIGLVILLIAAAAFVIVPSNSSDPTNPAPLSAASTCVPSVSSPPSALSRQLQALRLVNYFPSDAGWQYMWTQWDPDQIDHDFAVMANLGANAVRITVFPSVMGFPTPSPVMQNRLAQILAMAGGHGLEVQLSLFDQFTDFTDIPGSLTWAHDLLAPLNAGSRIAFVDLRNELDTSSVLGDPRVYRWVDALLPAVEADARGVPVTLSVTASDRKSVV